MTQLVELQAALPKLTGANVKVYAISYDEVGALAAFADAHGITYELLADEGSKVIRRFGILNHLVPEHEVPYHGIPFPGTYLVDTDGTIAAKFFHRGLGQRESPETWLDAFAGRIELSPDEPTVTTSDESGINWSLTYHGGGGVVRGGSIRRLVLRAELPDGLHLYDEPVPAPMVATSVELVGPPGMRALPVETPATHSLDLPGIGELPVWDGQVDFVLPVWADNSIASLVDDSNPESVTVEVDVRYQACTNTECLLPRTERLAVEVPVGRYTAPGAFGEAMLGADASSMDSRSWMLAKVTRALDAAPDRAAAEAFLAQTAADYAEGPLAPHLAEARAQRADQSPED